MKILIDTHILLWHLTDDPRLSVEKSEMIKDTTNNVFVSMATLWEITIKTSLKKLDAPFPIEFLVPKAMTILPIEVPHISMLQKLALHHGDPFDRMIIAQAMTENLMVLSVDNEFKNYPIHLV